MAGAQNRKAKLSWLSKLGSLLKKSNSGCLADTNVPVLHHTAGSPSPWPLDANNPRKPMRAKPAPWEVHHDDTYSQQVALSDQASGVRVDDPALSSDASEHHGSDYSLSDPMQAANAYMATLRSLLVNHISEVHEACCVDGKLADAGANAAAEAQTAESSSVADSPATPASTSASKVRSQPLGSASADRKVQAPLVDQTQLLELVQTLISDHRASLLEQRRLQQKLAAAQEALYEVQLHKDKAAALADLRSEEASQAQAHLQQASAAVLHLQSACAISSRRLQLPASKPCSARTPACVPANQWPESTSTPQMDSTVWRAATAGAIKQTMAVLQKQFNGNAACGSEKVEHSSHSWCLTTMPANSAISNSKGSTISSKTGSRASSSGACAFHGSDCCQRSSDSAADNSYRPAELASCPTSRLPAADLLGTAGQQATYQRQLLFGQRSKSLRPAHTTRHTGHVIHPARVHYNADATGANAAAAAAVSKVSAAAAHIAGEDCAQVSSSQHSSSCSGKYSDSQVSSSSTNSSVLADAGQQLCRPPVESPAKCAAAAAGHVGSFPPFRQLKASGHQQQHQAAAAVGSIAGSKQDIAGTGSSNGGSWPAVKLSANRAPQIALQQPNRQAIGQQRPKGRARARVRGPQPMVLSTSLESAASLPVAAQHPAYSGSHNSSMGLGDSSCLPCIGNTSISCSVSSKEMHLGVVSQVQRDASRHFKGSMPQAQSEQQLALSAAAASCTDNEANDALTSSSELACGSMVSTATGCTNLSSLAGVDLQQPKVGNKPRPAAVPQLPLQLLENQQDQQQQQQQLQPLWPTSTAAIAAAVPANAAARHTAGSNGYPPNSARARLMAQVDDMAPLIAQPGSARNRRGTPCAITPCDATEAAGLSQLPNSSTAAASNVSLSAHATAKASKHTGTASYTAVHLLSQRAHSFAGNPLWQPPVPHGTAAAIASATTTAQPPTAGLSSTSLPSPGGSSNSRQCPTVITGSATAAGPYWGSSIGSGTASQATTRQPTPVAGITAHWPGCEHSIIGTDALVSNHVQPAASAVVANVASNRTGPEVAQLPGQLQGQPGLAIQRQGLPPCTLTTPYDTAAPLGVTPCSAAAAAIGSFMTMRPVHMYKSVSTVYAMYSPLTGGLHALGRNRPESAGAAGQFAEADPLAFPVTTGIGLGPISIRQQQQRVGARAATSSVAAVTAAAALRHTSRTPSEYDWQGLLGTVPEEEGMQGSSVAGNQCAAAAVAENGHVPVVAIDAATVDVAAVASADVHAVLPAPLQIHTNTAATRPAMQVLPQTCTQQQHSGQQAEEQEREQHKLQQLQKDVVQQGPLFIPSNSPPELQLVAAASSPRGGRQQWQQCSTGAVSQAVDAAAADALAASSEVMGLASIEVASCSAPSPAHAAVGPLTASSHTRLRGGSNRAAGCREQQRQQQSRHMAATADRAAAVGRIREAAATVAARVAAAAAISGARQHWQPASHVRQQQQHQQGGPEGNNADSVQQHGSVGSSNAARQGQMPQEPNSHGRLRGSSCIDRTPQSQRKRRRRHRQQQQQPQQQRHYSASLNCQQQHQQEGRHASRGHGSSVHHRPVRASRTCDNELEADLLVSTYQNPMSALEAAGFEGSDGEAMVNAGLLPGYTSTAVSSPACRPMQHGFGSGMHGVDAAAVPAHVTPLARERSVAKPSSPQGTAVAISRQGTAGQLHWNPLYDPEAIDASLVISSC